MTASRIGLGKTMSKDNEHSNQPGWTATYHREWQCTQLTPPSVPIGRKVEEEMKIAEETFRKMVGSKSEKNSSE